MNASARAAASPVKDRISGGRVGVAGGGREEVQQLLVLASQLLGLLERGVAGVGIGGLCGVLLQCFHPAHDAVEPGAGAWLRALSAARTGYGAVAEQGAGDGLSGRPTTHLCTRNDTGSTAR
ncbi:hypothetical protein ACIQM4_02805 [Streptomyces sp. NPDC091272]|uniref:hypothetical protein n=1 Tax=Streptomyces sp. NPDC091272 TaxID=3365981 RepID=UPI00382D1104